MTEALDLCIEYMAFLDTCIFYTYAEMEYKKDTETKGSVTLWLTFDSEGGKKKGDRVSYVSGTFEKKNDSIGFYAFVREDVVSRLSLGNNESRRK